MKKYLAIYIGTPAARADSGWDALDEGERRSREAAGIKAWGDWMNANGAAILDSGGPLGQTRRVSAKGVEDVSNAMTGYVTLEAESYDEAARRFRDHPHFAIFPGEAVEIMECLPIPEA